MGSSESIENYDNESYNVENSYARGIEFVCLKYKSIIFNQCRSLRLIEGVDISLIDNFINQCGEKRVYLIKYESELLGFALVSKCVFDPEGKSDNLYMNEYIFILPKRRRLGYGKRLMTYIKTDIDYASYPDSKMSEDFHTALGMQKGSEGVWRW